LVREWFAVTGPLESIPLRFLIHCSHATYMVLAFSFMVSLVSLVMSDETDSSRLVARGESGPCSSSRSNSFHEASFFVSSAI
jgi:hypothetical protein